MNAQNNYQYTRAIRFKLNENKLGGTLPKEELKKESLPELIKNLNEIQDKLKGLFLYTNKEQEECVTKSLEVKKDWLLNFHKSQYISFTKNRSSKKYKLDSLKRGKTNENYFQPQFKICLKDLMTHVKTLEDCNNRPEESQNRKSELAYAVRGLLNRTIYDYIYELLKNLSSSNNYHLDSQRDKLIALMNKIKPALNYLEEDSLASQSHGVEVARASFNYFTVNKKAKEYFDEQIEKIKVEQKATFSEFKGLSLKYVAGQTIFSFNQPQEKEWLKNYREKFSVEDKLTIGQTVTLLANFKSDQKSIFHELLAHSVSDDKKKSSYTTNNEKLSIGNKAIIYNSINTNRLSLNSKLSLFTLNSDDDVKNLLKLKKENKDLKKYTFGNYALCNGYKEFCNTFKTISMENGQLTSRIENFEKQKLESQRASYWSMIYRDDDQSKLLLIPRDKIMDAKKSIDKFQSADNGSLYILNSITMRALEKLCFAEESTFVKEMENNGANNLFTLQKEVKEMSIDIDRDVFKQEVERSTLLYGYNKSKKSLQNEQRNKNTTKKRKSSIGKEIKNLEEKIKKEKTALKEKLQQQKIEQKRLAKLEFYKKVVCHQYTKERVNLNYDLSKCLTAKTLTKFEKEFEAACYKFQSFQFTNDQLKQFIEDFAVVSMDITSYDLEGRNKKENPSDDRKVTKIWHQFWSQEKNSEYGEVRLNPELRINYREADTELKRYLQNRGFSKDIKHRRLQEQYTVAFTFALQAGNIYDDLSFIKPEQQLEKINQFNKEFREKQTYDTAYRYGIDVGQIELANLCLTNRTEGLYNSNGTFDGFQQKYDFPEFEVYTLNDLTYTETYETKSEPGIIKKRYAVKNPSYFIDHDKELELFDKVNRSSLDLSCAKLIKGKIVTNGDLVSYIKLKKMVAKKTIYELFHRDRKDNRDDLEIELSNINYSRDGKNNTEEENQYISITFGTNDKGNLCGKTLIHLRDAWKDVVDYTANDLHESLGNYLDELKTLEQQRKNTRKEDKEFRKENLHTPTHQQINNLRNALVANMVGIICHLQKKLPGYVFLEDLGKNSIDNQFSQDNSYIARRLEFALYKKFQSLGLVPPHIKDIVSLRETIRDTKNNSFNAQFGAIVFVNEKYTSKTCPHCLKVSPEDNVTKMTSHTYECKPKDSSSSCGFTTDRDQPLDSKFDWLKPIDNPDSLAAFNIARKIDSEEKLIALKK